MGKAAKAHRKKVAKRNANVKQTEKRMQKLWQEAFEEQMKVMKEKFASMSGETSSGETSPMDLFSEMLGLPNEEIQEETVQEGSEPTEPIKGE